MNQLMKATATQPAARGSLFSDSGPVNWLRTEIDRLFDDFGRPNGGFFNLASKLPTPVPAIEMIEEDKNYRLSAELPGMTDKDVEITVADGALTISGEKKEESERKGNGYLLSERRYGSFRRELALPSDADPASIKARFNNGVLNVTIAKDKNAQSRQHKIPIES